VIRRISESIWNLVDAIALWLDRPIANVTANVTASSVLGVSALRHFARTRDSQHPQALSTISGHRIRVREELLLAAFFFARFPRFPYSEGTRARDARPVIAASIELHA